MPRRLVPCGEAQLDSCMKYLQCTGILAIQKAKAIIVEMEDELWEKSY